MKKISKIVLIIINIFSLLVIFSACEKIPKKNTDNTVINNNSQEDVSSLPEDDITIKDANTLTENEHLSIISPNTTTMGLTTYDNNKIYYSSNKGGSINSINKDGTDKKILTYHRASDLTYYNSKIYFARYDVNDRCDYLYSMNTDGSNCKKVINDKITYSYYIYDDIIYYKSWDLKLYSYNLNTEENILIKDAEIRNSVIYNNKLYYHQEGYYGNLVEYNMTDGTEKVYDLYTGAYIQFFDEYLYFYIGSELNKFNVHTKETTEIIKEDGGALSSEYFYVTKNYIFFNGREYKNDKDTANKLYRMKHDGTEVTKLTEFKVETFSVAEDKIFVTDGFEFYKEDGISYTKVLDFDGNVLNWDI